MNAVDNLSAEIAHQFFGFIKGQIQLPLQRQVSAEGHRRRRQQTGYAAQIDVAAGKGDL